MSSPTNPTQVAERRLLEELARLGGSRIQDDELAREGRRFVIPETMSVHDAINYLIDYQDRQQSEQRYSRTFQARPWDGAAALERGMRKLFGTVGLPKPTIGFFSKTPPELRTIKVGVDETIQVPWGQIAAPMLGEGAIIYTGSVVDEEYGPLFYLTIDAPRKSRAVVEGLFKVVEDELVAHSIYKGQAITGQDDPDFVDLSGVDPERLVYSAKDRVQLEANLWSLLRHTDRHRAEGLSLKRAVLLGGNYGTGKTETAKLTAKIANENGWGFIMCRPGRDDLEQVFATARLLQPCVVFFEDIENVSAVEGGEDHITRVLDLFDGLQAKGTELIAVVTTNHLDKLHKGMYRPGRIDAVIEFSDWDAPAFQQFITQKIGEDRLAEDINWERVAASMEGYTPSWVNEVADRVVRYAWVENDGDVGTVSEDALIAAAEGLRRQLDLQDGASDRREIPTLDESLTTLVRETVDSALNGTIVHSSYMEEDMPVQANGNGKALSGVNS